MHEYSYLCKLINLVEVVVCMIWIVMFVSDLTCLWFSWGLNMFCGGLVAAIDL